MFLAAKLSDFLFVSCHSIRGVCDVIPQCPDCGHMCVCVRACERVCISERVSSVLAGYLVPRTDHKEEKDERVQDVHH